jgi:hypothetical protein
VKKTACIAAFAALLAAALPAQSLWRYPEAAGKNALFVDVAIAPLSFKDVDSFSLFPLEARADYVLPVGLPISAGLFMKLPSPASPNLKSFGVRLAYHFDVRDPKTDLYFMYAFDFGFTRNGILAQYNDTPAPVHWFDFRLGVRRLLGGWFCFSAETDFKALGLVFALSIKLN